MKLLRLLMAPMWAIAIAIAAPVAIVAWLRSIGLIYTLLAIAAMIALWLVISSMVN